MVSRTEIQASNARMATTLPPGIIAVFVGATSGIGETSLREFARHAPKPRIYFTGRSQEAGDRITRELKTLNPGGEFIFVSVDGSLLVNVDAVCKDLKAKEKAINVLFLCQGTLNITKETSENLSYAMALTYYARVRFAANLLPLVRRATGLRRIVTVMAGGKEGPVYPDDFQCRKVPMLQARGHQCTMLTLSLEALAKKAPEVTFIHDFPGSVKTNLIRGDEGFAMQVFKYAFKAFGPLFLTPVPLDVCGEGHAFLCSSARFPPREGAAEGAGVPVEGELEVARGIDGVVGSGVYSAKWDGEVSGPEVVEILAKHRRDGITEKLWKHTEDEFVRITGLAAA